MTTADETMSRGDSEASKPKVLVFIDRDVEATIYSSKSGKKTSGMKHTEVVTCYQTKDGTETSKDENPAIVINREKIDWSLSVQGNTLETVAQWRETFDVGKGIQFGAKFIKVHETDKYEVKSDPHASYQEILIPVAQDEWIAIQVEEALIETESKSEYGDHGKIQAKDGTTQAAAAGGGLFLGGIGSPSYTLEVLKATRSKIVIEKDA